MSRGTERERGRRRLQALFAIDLRSLALFRICLALLISFDLAKPLYRHACAEARS